MSRKSPRLAAMNALAMNAMTLEEPARRSPRLAKLAQPLTVRRSDRIAQAKAAAQAEQAERAETAAARVEAPLRRSVRINKPSDGNTVLRWQAFVKEIMAENTISDSDYEDCSDYDDYDYEVYKH